MNPIRLQKLERQNAPSCASVEDAFLAGSDQSVFFRDPHPPAGDTASIFCSDVKFSDVERKGAVRIMLPGHWLEKPFNAAGVGLSVLHDPVVFGGRIRRRNKDVHWDGQCLIRSNGGLTEDSFGVMDGAATYAGDILSSSAEEFSYIGPSAASRVEGDYFLLGNAHHHFGHFILEGLSRLWALEYAERHMPGFKILIYEPDVPPFVASLLSCLGFPADRIAFASPAGIYERLLVARPAMRTHHWITSFQRRTWASVAASAEPGAGERKLYLSRRAVTNRRLENEDEVERVFEECGFEILRPEALSMSEQIRLAASASVMAGSVGSQMYLAAFMPPGGRVLVMAPQNFYLKDDFLISIACGLGLKVQLGSAIDFSSHKNERNWRISRDSVLALLAEGMGTG